MDTNDSILAHAIAENPNAVVKYRTVEGHINDCSCMGCRPVLTENLWYGSVEPAPENLKCVACGNPLTLAARGLFEVIGSYTLVQKWWFPCCSSLDS